MKYVCLNPSCKREFMHAAKMTEIPKQTEFTMIHPVPTAFPANVIEKSCCPHCGSLDFDEVQEESEKSSEKIVAVRSAEFGEVEALVKEGWEVKEVYSKNVVLVKKEIAQVVEKVPCPKCGSKNVEETLTPFPTSSDSFDLMAWTTFRCKDCGVLYFSGEVVVKEAKA